MLTIAAAGYLLFTFLDVSQTPFSFDASFSASLSLFVTKIGLGQAWLWIVDTGSGMPQALLASHVKPAHAQQASEHVGQSTERGGWGLGLYSANHIAHRQGWSLIFKSRLGHGTTVRIRLGPVIAEASGG